MKFLKIKSADMPTKPKPTEQLPNNLMYVWDPNANDWIILQKDTNKATPPLYDPNNQNVTNQTTSYMSNIKSASSEIVDKNGKKAEEGMWLYKPIVHSTFRGDIPLRLFQVKIRHQKDGTDKPYLLSENKLITKGISHIKDGILFDTYEEAKQYSESHKTKEEKEFDKLDDWQKTDYYLSKQSSCLSKFLDGPQYSKEIKIEAGLIKNGLVKYAGFDFNRGTKYAITTKGLEVLRKASEAEHNEALNEREKLAYMFGFNTDKVSTLDTTGKVIKQSARKWTICEADGSELGEVEADSELDAKVKFGIEHPEYADSQSICAKEIKASKEFFVEYSYPARTEDAWYITTDKVEANTEEEALQIAKEKLIGADNFHIVNKGFSNSDLYTKDSKPKYFHKDWYYDGEKLINEYTNFDKDAKYEETTESREPYPNPSETPNDHIILENHDGWVNTASFEDDIRKQFQKPHQKLSNSDRDLELLEKQVLDLIDEDKKEQIKALFDKVQFSDKEAAQVTPEFAKLHKLLGEYRKQNLIQLSDLDGNLVASGDPQIINELEHQVKDIGYYCESVDEYTDSDYAETYSLKIFMK